MSSVLFFSVSSKFCTEMSKIKRANMRLTRFKVVARVCELKIVGHKCCLQLCFLEWEHQAYPAKTCSTCLGGENSITHLSGAKGHGLLALLAMS